jgi:hypothetical protein
MILIRDYLDHHYLKFYPIQVKKLLNAKQSLNEVDQVESFTKDLDPKDGYQKVSREWSVDMNVGGSD